MAFHFRRILRQIIKAHEIKRCIGEEIRGNLHIYDTKWCAIRNIESFSTKVFMSSLKQQGQVKDLIGDNGTNIVGAELEPKDALNGIDQNCITNFLSQHSSEWKFNLRSSPWMGDIWEAFIKSVQDTLKVVIQSRLFILEMLATLMCKFESILNQILIT